MGIGARARRINYKKNFEKFAFSACLKKEIML
jgi:hypothetical protein